MFQQRKKDYLQRLIEEFFAKLHEIQNEDNRLSPDERLLLMNECFLFFDENFGVTRTDDYRTVVESIDKIELLEQYARLLVTEYELSTDKNNASLTRALAIVEYLQDIDTVYSWSRTVLREDILRLRDISPN